jgi:cytochrome c peroxidase
LSYIYLSTNKLEKINIYSILTQLNNLLRTHALTYFYLKSYFTKLIVIVVLASIAFQSLASEPILPILKKKHLNNKKFELGKLLFVDTRLSKNQDRSCHSCHNLALGGADGLKKPVNLAFNSPTILNVSKNYYIGWKGEYSQLKPQLEMILQKPDVMGTDWAFVIPAFKKDQLYSKLFSSIYNNGISKENIIDAILYYESNLILPSKFDEFLLGDNDAISLSAKQGYNNFKDYGCASCHQGANVGGNIFQELGVVLPYKGIIGQYKTEKLRVPSLRNVAKTAPYFSDGTVKSLKKAIEIMAKHQLGQKLTDTEIDQIADFLKSLDSIME